jgi:4-amino-4-deoxy-L-arabinose transferase-like glycosyltransferase
VLGVGPTVILPIAAAFALLEVDYLYARLVIVLYAIGALWALFALARNLVDEKFAWIAVALMLWSGEFVYHSRAVFGEIPGLFFLLAALWLWFRSAGAATARLVVVGLLFGLACVTKSQYAVIALPSLLLAWMADLIVYRRHRWRYFLVPGIVAGAVYAAWMTFVLFGLGADERDVRADFELFRATSAYTLLQWHADNLRTLWWSYPLYGRLCVLAFPFFLLFGPWRGARGQEWVTLVIFVGMAGVFYLSSFGWSRYAIPVMSLSVLVTAYFLHSIAGGLAELRRFLPAALARRTHWLRRGGGLLVTGLLLGLLGRTLIDVAGWRGHEGALEMAAYLDFTLPEDTLIETLEQEFAIFTDHAYHYPSQAINVQLTAEWQARGRLPGQSFDHIPYRIEPDYVLKRTTASVANDFYSTARLQSFEPLLEVPGYSLYQRAGAILSRAD